MRLSLAGLKTNIYKRRFQTRLRFGLKSSGLLFDSKSGLKSTIGLK